jgi:hypothetical protein
MLIFLQQQELAEEHLQARAIITPIFLAKAAKDDVICNKEIDKYAQVVMENPKSKY